MGLLAVLSARAITAASGQLRLSGSSESYQVWPYYFAIGCGLISILAFYPAELRALNQTAEVIEAPLRAAESAAGSAKSYIFWTQLQRPNAPMSSWVFFPPLPVPRMDEQLIWVFDDPANNEALLAAHPERTPFRLLWGRDGEPKVVPYNSEKTP